MPLLKKNLTSELTTGFGEKSTQSGGRFFRKDGKANVRKKGLKFLDQFSWYHTMLSLPQWKFWFWLLFVYFSLNVVFAFVYFAIGIEHLAGIEKKGGINDFIETFFFSAQTFTTVGYGRISPVGVLTSSIASLQAFMGVLSFALASGLFYGRFSRPRSFLKFSDIAVIAPFKDGRALMFRTVPYKNNHLLDGEVKITLAIKSKEGKNEFYSLPLEISKINILALNWTIVHAIDEASAMYGLTENDLKEGRAEVMVFLKAFDEVFSNTVVARTSYTWNEIVYGAKFKPMFNPNTQGDTTVLHIELLNEIEMVELPELTMAVSG